jgi:hypothetical protein
MIDTHVHIGQFNEVYYEPLEIMRIIEHSMSVDACCFSSTSKGKYSDIEQEIQSVFKIYSAKKMRPYFRFMPDFVKQGVTVHSAMNGLPYKGFKLHPADGWDFENDVIHTHHLHQIFDYASRHYADDFNLPILIHTGENGTDRPSRFEPFFKEYPNAKIILAHCRPVDETIKMFQQYTNVCGDTSFASRERINEIINAGYIDRLIGGTDFPITHYFAQKYSDTKLSLSEQYQQDVQNYLTIKNK